ncbi:MAG: response regulator, partial [Clostridiales bacterium]|nr:response regulator [Clostridiales bacterium]
MYKILLIEDDLNIQEVIRDYFNIKSEKTIHIDTASNGQTGLEKAYENTYDLRLLDVMLPESDGVEICSEVRRRSEVSIRF